MAFEDEGFCVVRGPDLLWGGDIKKFHPPSGRFDGVIGGPPCQIFSIMKRLNPRAGEKHGNLIPEFERCVAEAQPTWFLMENVPGAPLPMVDKYFVESELVKDVWVGGETSRLRRFSFGRLVEGFLAGPVFDVETLALHCPNPSQAILAGGGGARVPVALGGSGKRKKTADGKRHGPHDGPRAPLEDMLRAQGLPVDFLADAPFTKDGKVHAIGNGVPLSMGRAIAKAVREAVYVRIPNLISNPAG